MTEQPRSTIVLVKRQFIDNIPIETFWITSEWETKGIYQVQAQRCDHVNPLMIYSPQGYFHNDSLPEWFETLEEAEAHVEKLKNAPGIKKRRIYEELTSLRCSLVQALDCAKKLVSYERTYHFSSLERSIESDLDSVEHELAKIRKVDHD